MDTIIDKEKIAYMLSSLKKYAESGCHICRGKGYVMTNKGLFACNCIIAGMHKEQQQK